MAATAQSAIAVIGIDIGKNSFQGLRIQEYARVRARSLKSRGRWWPTAADQHAYSNRC